MLASNTTAFDAIAADYDASFSRSLTGNSQRARVRKWMNGFLKDKQQLNILEINCGTGDDALWLSSLGHRVIATDASAAMIGEAKKKAIFATLLEPLQFFQCAFSELPSLLAYERFDLIFSNFSGLNCISPVELKTVGRKLHGLLQPGGHMAVVIFSKYNYWEMFYYLLKGKPGKAFRRWKTKASVSELKEGAFQPVYYYSTSRFCKLFSPFTRIEKRPVGLFIPPSYLEPFMQKRPRLFRLLERLEKKAGGITVFSAFADHQYLLLKKKRI